MTLPITTTDHWIKSSQGKIFARSWSSENPSTKDKAPILLFHDSLGCTQLWRDFPEALARSTDRIVISYDRLGFGQSDAQVYPAHIDFIENEAQVYFKLVTDYFKSAQFILFGHSVGGAMAVYCASLFPEKCVAVITESSQAFVEDRTLAGISIAKRSFENLTEFNKLKKYHGDKALWVLKAWTEVWLSKEFSSWSLESALKKTNRPLLAMHGENDEFGSKKFPEMISQMTIGPSEMQLLENCGHVPHREQLDMVLQIVNSFLKKFKIP